MWIAHQYTKLQSIDIQWSNEELNFFEDSLIPESLMFEFWLFEKIFGRDIASEIIKLIEKAPLTTSRIFAKLTQDTDPSIPQTQIYLNIKIVDAVDFSKIKFKTNSKPSKENRKFIRLNATFKYPIGFLKILSNYVPSSGLDCFVFARNIPKNILDYIAVEPENWKDGKLFFDHKTLCFEFYIDKNTETIEFKTMEFEKMHEPALKTPLRFEFNISKEDFAKILI